MRLTREIAPTPRPRYDTVVTIEVAWPRRDSSTARDTTPMSVGNSAAVPGRGHRESQPGDEQRGRRRDEGRAGRRGRRTGEENGAGMGCRETAEGEPGDRDRAREHGGCDGAEPLT
jgi:hypothetical protein